MAYLSEPVVDVQKGSSSGHVEDEDEAIGVSVVVARDPAVSLLPRRVPQLQSADLPPHHRLHCLEVHANRRDLKV